MSKEQINLKDGGWICAVSGLYRIFPHENGVRIQAVLTFHDDGMERKSVRLLLRRFGTAKKAVEWLVAFKPIDHVQEVEVYCEFGAEVIARWNLEHFDKSMLQTLDQNLRNKNKFKSEKKEVGADRSYQI